MHEVSEAELLEAMKVAHEAIKIHCKAQMELTEEVGKTVKREYNHEVNDEDLAEKLLADTVTVELYSTTSISEGEVSSTVGGGYALSSE